METTYEPGPLTKLVADFAARELGEAVVEVLTAGGEQRSLEVLSSGSCPSSYVEFRLLLEAVSGALGGPEQLLRVADAPSDDEVASATREMMRGMGSPEAIFRTVAATKPMSAIFDAEFTEVSPREWTMTIRAWPGLPQYRELCATMAATYAAMPTAFGGRPAVVVEEQCQCDGAPECRLRLRWDPWEDENGGAELVLSRLAVAEGQLEQFQAMITDLVSGERHEEILQRIVLAAAGSSAASCAVLATAWGSPPRTDVKVVGMDKEQGAHLARRLLGGESIDDAFAVDVASSRSVYGKLAVLGPAARFVALSPRMLESYGRLAAAALDSAGAMAEARRQGDTARALLDLSRSLAEVVSTDEMAANVARAVAVLVDCDRSAVLLAEAGPSGAGGGELRLAAGYGYPDRVVADMDPVPGHFRQQTADADGLVWLWDTAAGSEVVVAAPILVAAGVIGWVTAGVTSGSDRLVSNTELPGRLKGLAAQAASAISNARLVDQIRHQSMHDSLTGLPNRGLILDRLEQMLARAGRTSSPVAALFVDLDGFKEINDSLGHDSGDRLLCAIAQRLATTVRPADTVGRLGGDEFVVLVEGATFDAGPELVAERLLNVMREPFFLPGANGPQHLSASVGVATATKASAPDVLRDADIALYEAKRAGKNTFVMFDPEMQMAMVDLHLLEMDLRQALANDEFFLLYQPIFDLNTRRTTGVEALLRWRHPTRGIVVPDRFVPRLEESGLICEVGAWVLEQATTQGAAWHRAGYLLDISVNVSARQLDNNNFVHQLQRALDRSELPAASLIIELTETAIMRNIDAVIPRLRAIKGLGVRVAIDDFGTGYSSLAYLRQLPVDTLKIDQSFVSAMADSAEAGALVHTLVQLGKTLGMRTLAEGIEEQAQYARLQEEECDDGQGFLYAKPLPANDILAFLTAMTPGMVMAPR